MLDSAPDPLRQPIDARPLIATEILVGASTGLLIAAFPAWGLTLALPDLKVTNFPCAVGIAALLVVSAMACGAVVGACKARGRVLTDEQRAVVRSHARRASIRAALYVTPFAFLVLLGVALTIHSLEANLPPRHVPLPPGRSRPNIFPVVALGMGAYLLQSAWVGVAALVGWQRGMKLAAAMQRSTRASAGAISGRLRGWAERRPAPPDGPAPHFTDVPEELHRLDEAKRLADMGLED